MMHGSLPKDLKSHGVSRRAFVTLCKSVVATLAPLLPYLRA